MKSFIRNEGRLKSPLPNGGRDVKTSPTYFPFREAKASPTPPINNGISKTMQLIKGRASRQINALREAKASPTHVYGIAPKGEGAPRIKGINKTMGRGDFSRPIIKFPFQR